MKTLLCSCRIIYDNFLRKNNLHFTLFVVFSGAYTSCRLFAFLQGLLFSALVFYLIVLVTCWLDSLRTRNTLNDLWTTVPSTQLGTQCICRSISGEKMILILTFHLFLTPNNELLCLYSSYPVTLKTVIVPSNVFPRLNLSLNIERSSSFLFGGLGSWSPLTTQWQTWFTWKRISLDIQLATWNMSKLNSGW